MVTPRQRAAGLRRERVDASPQRQDGVFANPGVTFTRPTGGVLPMLGEYFRGGQERRPPAPLPLERPHDVWARPPATGLRATWLGHSTVLLELDGRRVLTDPVFASRISPVPLVGPRRFHPVPATIAELPPLDLVVLSHDHYDHLCRPSQQALARTGVPIVTALGVGAHLERFGWAPGQITELDWHDSVEVGGVRVTATPSQHFSGRGPTDRNHTLWASWVIQSERHKVFFSGDTGLTPQFAAIGAAHGPFDLVMLEVGAFHPAWGTIHLGPANALTAFEMLGGGTLLPVHWGTFNLAFHAWDDPAETLYTLAAERGARILTPRPGGVVEPAHAERPEPWWRAVLSARARTPRRRRSLTWSTPSTTSPSPTISPRTCPR